MEKRSLTEEEDLLFEAMWQHWIGNKDEAIKLIHEIIYKIEHRKDSLYGRHKLHGFQRR